MRRLLPPHRSLITPRTPGPTATTAALILAPHLTAPLTDPGNRIFHIVPSTGALLSSTLSGLDKTFRLKRASVVATVPVSSWKRLLALMKRVRQEVGRSSELDMAWVRRMCEELERWGEGGGEGERLAVWRCEAGVRSGGSLVNTLYEGSVVGCTNVCVPLAFSYTRADTDRTGIRTCTYGACGCIFRQEKATKAVTSL